MRGPLGGASGSASSRSPLKASSLSSMPKMASKVSSAFKVSSVFMAASLVWGC